MNVTHVNFVKRSAHFVVCVSHSTIISCIIVEIIQRVQVHFNDVFTLIKQSFIKKYLFWNVMLIKKKLNC